MSFTTGSIFFYVHGGSTIICLLFREEIVELGLRGDVLMALRSMGGRWWALSLL